MSQPATDRRKPQECWVIPEKALDGEPGNIWPVRRVARDDPTFMGEVEVVRATDYVEAMRNAEALVLAWDAWMNDARAGNDQRASWRALVDAVNDQRGRS